MPKKTVKAVTTKKSVVKDKTAMKKTKKVVEKVKKSKTEVKKANVETAIEPNEEKRQIIEQFQVTDGDTGSPEVQVALLTKRIEKLVSHLKTNPSDNHSRRGLLGIVSKRRRLLNYLEKKDKTRYKQVVAKLGMTK